jgi:hypothetical protein
MEASFLRLCPSFGSLETRTNSAVGRIKAVIYGRLRMSLG